MGSIPQILQKMDPVCGFIRFYKIQIMETHSRVTTLYNCKTTLQQMDLKKQYPANAFMEKKCAYQNPIKHVIVLNVHNKCILIQIQKNNCLDVLLVLLG